MKKGPAVFNCIAALNLYLCQKARTRCTPLRLIRIKLGNVLKGGEGSGRPVAFTCSNYAVIDRISKYDVTLLPEG